MIARQHDLCGTRCWAATIRASVYRAKVDYGHRSPCRGSTRSVLQVPNPPSAERAPSARAACSAAFRMSSISAPQCEPAHNCSRRFRLFVRDGPRELRMCLANRAAPHPAGTEERGKRSRERNHSSLAREVVPKQTPDIIKIETHFSSEGTHAVVARRMVARFNCAI